MKRILITLIICFLIAPASFSQDIKLSGQVSVENNQIKMLVTQLILKMQ